MTSNSYIILKQCLFTMMLTLNTFADCMYVHAHGFAENVLALCISGQPHKSRAIIKRLLTCMAIC